MTIIMGRFGQIRPTLTHDHETARAEGASLSSWHWDWALRVPQLSVAVCVVTVRVGLLRCLFGQEALRKGNRLVGI